MITNPNMSQDPNIVANLLLSNYKSEIEITPVHLPILTHWLRQKSSTLIRVLHIVVSECEHRHDEEREQIKSALQLWQASVQNLGKLIC